MGSGIFPTPSQVASVERVHKIPQIREGLSGRDRAANHVSDSRQLGESYSVGRT